MFVNKETDLIKEVATIRARNNGLWMGILEIALKSNPVATRDVLKQINQNDARITKCLSEL
jgi:hypothetical protein